VSCAWIDCCQLYCSKELKEGIEILTAKIQRFKPKIAVFNGKGTTFYCTFYLITLHVSFSSGFGFLLFVYCLIVLFSCCTDCGMKIEYSWAELESFYFYNYWNKRPK